MMKLRMNSAPLAAALALSALPVSVAAQDQPYKAPRASTYEEVLALPDWTGTWHQDWSKLFGEAVKPMVLTPEAKAELDAFNARYGEHGPPLDKVAQCLPPGMPQIMSVGGMPIEILFSPGRVTILLEAYSQMRRIYTDGRALPDDPEFFFNGNSVGRWEGDVLVIDTIGLHPMNDIARGGGVSHSEQLRIRERIYQPGPDQLIDEITLTDPAVLAEPFVSRIYYKRENEFPLREYVCEENNRLIAGEDGANIDLGLDDPDDPFGPLPEAGAKPDVGSSNAR